MRVTPERFQHLSNVRDALADSRVLAGAVHRVPVRTFNGLRHPLIRSGIHERESMRMGVYGKPGGHELRILLQPVDGLIGVPVYRPLERNSSELANLAGPFTALSGVISARQSGLPDFKLFGENPGAEPVVLDFVGDNEYEATDTFLMNIAFGISDTLRSVRADVLARNPETLVGGAIINPLDYGL